MILEGFFPWKGSDGLVVSIGMPRQTKRDFHLNFTSQKPALYEKGGFRFADVTIKETERTRFCQTLADSILTEYQSVLLAGLVKKRYFYFTASEQEEIYRIAQSYQNCKVRLGEDKYRDILAQRLNRFLEQNHEINLDGFVRFRMEDYRRDLEDTVDQAAEDYLVDREYKEFIGMLTCLAEIQPCLVEMVNILPLESGEYEIFDGQEAPIVSKETEQPFGALTPDDQLLSRLITLSPEKIVIHRRQDIANKELVNTLLNVFGKKVRFCNGCSFCLKNK